MQQIKVSLDETQLEFVNRFKDLGYKDKSALVRAAIQFLAEEYERAQLTNSADLYAELFDEDDEAIEWTSAALENWPA